MANPPCLLAVVADATRTAISMAFALVIVLAGIASFVRGWTLISRRDPRARLGRLHLLLAAELATAGAVLLWVIPGASPCGVWPI